jgi:preprotein translocase SecE subunit
VAKTRAQRKAEQRRRQQQQAQRPHGAPAPTETDAEAQHQTQVPESADVIEAELAEQGADLEALRGEPAETPAPAPSRADIGRPADAGAEVEPADKISRRSRRREEREARARAKESEKRRAPKELKAPAERQRGGVIGFFASCVAELRRVQWPDRETLIQATAITIVFIAVLAAYLGVLDGIFNWLVQRIL